MIMVDFVLVFLFALILSSVLGWGFGWRHPTRRDELGQSMIFLFVILMFAMGTGGAWLPPWGPFWHGTSWLTFLIVGILVSLLLLAIATPPRRPRTTEEAVEEMQETAAVGTAFGIFFWLLMLGLVIAAAVRYLVL